MALQESALLPAFPDNLVGTAVAFTTRQKRGEFLRHPTTLQDGYLMLLSVKPARSRV